MLEDEVQALRRMVVGKSSYVEIGTLWGGSAIEAATAEPKLQVYAIDPFNGYYGGADKWVCGRREITPRIEDVIANLVDAGVNDRVTLVRSKSDPFPLPNMMFDCGFIDGDHAFETVLQDWRNLSARCKTVAFHDVDDPDVARVVTSAKRKWKLIEHAGDLMIFTEGE